MVRLPSRVGSVVEGGGQESVHDHVSVSPDRGGEVGVERNAESVVPLVTGLRVLRAQILGPLQMEK